MVKRKDLKNTPEYKDRVSSNNKRLVKNYIFYCVLGCILCGIGAVAEFFSKDSDFFMYLMGCILVWIVFSLCYLVYALIVPYSVRDYFFVDRKIVKDSDGPDIYKLKDYDSNKWVKVSERDLWDSIPLNTTLTMVVKGRTLVDFYKESYEPSSIVRVMHKKEYNNIETKEMSFEEFKNYMNNGGENK